ncbi:MAG: NADH-quinone oxidoreductase subunit [Solirubrobacterales bacterium]|jgi:NADH-quinone oxidoreductase subunit M|nr:NADH-quinone oxidoreductase subunit [Solirubrobacterales bacterium]
MLSVLLWTPLVAGLVALAVPRAASRWVAVLGSLVALGLAIGLVADFDPDAAGLQHVVDHSWIPGLGVRYFLGVDGISVFLVLLTAVLWFAVTLWSALRNEPGDGRSRLYYFLVGLAGTAALGAFTAQDLLLFVLFFDLMLIPFFFLIGTFGGENRIAATTKMIVFTLVGSLLMLVGAIATAILASDSVGELSFSIPVLQQHLLSTGSQEWIFCFFAAAFLVKMPAFPIHGWMPDAYKAAPLPILILLSAVLSKVGAYGFLRVALPLFPAATSHFQELVMLIALASILYGSVMAFTQTNVRLIAGYSSVAQLGFITLGIFSLRADGADGAVLQMVNHGLVVAGVFMVIAILYDRTRTEDVTKMGGQAMRAPVLAALFLVIAMANLAIPGSSNFIGEFYILNGVFQSKIAFAFVAAIGIALAAFYSLRMYQRTMHNRLPEGAESREIGARDGLILAPLVAVIVALAFWPGLILERGQNSVTAAVEAATAPAAPETAGVDRHGWTGYAPVANHDRISELSAFQCTRLAKAVERWNSASLADDYQGGCE